MLGEVSCNINLIYMYILLEIRHKTKFNPKTNFVGGVIGM